MNTKQKKQHENLVEEIVGKHINNAFAELHKAGYRIAIKYEISINKYPQSQN